MPASKSPLPLEIREILAGLYNLLESDEEQNKTIPEQFRAPIEGGLDCDELPDAAGEFGRTPSNPIPTNGPLGEVIYLSRLSTSAGSPVMFHRVRAEEGSTGEVDVYEVLSLDGEVRETLFLSMYHPRKSRKAPRGYTLSANLDSNNFTYGVNHIVADFPCKLDAHIRRWHMEMLGLPLPVGRVREAVNGSWLRPSLLEEHEASGRSTLEGEMRSDLLTLLQASKDPRFEGRVIGIGVDGIVRPIDFDKND